MNRITDSYHDRAIYIALGVIVLAVIVGTGSLTYVLVRGPRMWVQPNIRTWQTEVVPMPEGTVPVNMPGGAPSLVQARALVNPLPQTPENIAIGRVYYDYYCVYCHGESGDGNGYVGMSYIPKPGDFHDPRIRAYGDGDLVRAMLLGEGHAPILEQVVLPEHRWHLALYTRYLGNLPPQPTPALVVVPAGPKDERSPLR